MIFVHLAEVAQSQNPKFENRNPKQIQMPEKETSKQNIDGHLGLNIGICFFEIVSDFVLRISDLDFQVHADRRRPAAVCRVWYRCKCRKAMVRQL
jgi:hypothetical protein